MFEREYNVEVKTVGRSQRLLIDTENTRLRCIIDKSDRQERFWALLDYIVMLRWLRRSTGANALLVLAFTLSGSPRRPSFVEFCPPEA
jgi:hypothetical protein